MVKTTSLSSIPNEGGLKIFLFLQKPSIAKQVLFPAQPSVCKATLNDYNHTEGAGPKDHTFKLLNNTLCYKKAIVAYISPYSLKKILLLISLIINNAEHFYIFNNEHLYFFGGTINTFSLFFDCIHAFIDLLVGSLTCMIYTNLFLYVSVISVRYLQMLYFLQQNKSLTGLTSVTITLKEKHRQTFLKFHNCRVGI